MDAKSLRSCLTLCDPIDGSLPSLRFSRQEHRSALPLPSPVLEENSLEMYIITIHPRPLNHKVCVVWVEPRSWCGWKPAGGVGEAQNVMCMEPGRWCGWSPTVGVDGAPQVVWVEPGRWYGWSPAVLWVEPSSWFSLDCRMHT